MGYRRRIPYISTFFSQKTKTCRLQFARQYRNKPKSFWYRGIYTDKRHFQRKVIEADEFGEKMKSVIVLIAFSGLLATVGNLL